MDNKNLLDNLKNILKENELHILVRWVDKEGANTWTLSTENFIKYCEDYGEEPMNVLETLREGQVYILNQDEKYMLYFILVGKNGEGIEYGLKYCHLFGF